MVNEPVQSANSIIAQALENAGVPPRDIDVPLEPELGKPGEGTPSLDGQPKGQVKGELEIEEEPIEPEAKPSEPKPSEPIVPPLSKVEIEAAITESSSKLQSMMDRKLNQINFQMQQTVSALNQFFQAQEDSGIAGLTPEEQTNKRLERLEKGGQSKIQISAQPIEQQPAQFYQQCVNFVDTIGLKVDDKRIDWAPDTGDPKVGFNRFLVSIKAALTEDQTKLVQELKDNGSKEITKLRKKTGVDKVSISGPSGPGLLDVSTMSPMQKIEYGFKVQEELSQVAK